MSGFLTFCSATVRDVVPVARGVGDLAALVRAVDGERASGLVGVGLDQDPVVHVVPEAEVGATLGDRGVAAQGVAADVVAVVVALQHFEAGEEDGVEEGGGDLADASADLVLEAPVRLDGWGGLEQPGVVWCAS